MKSIRQHVEDSIWHRIAKVGTWFAGEMAAPSISGSWNTSKSLCVEAVDEDESVILRLVPPRHLIGAVIEMADKKSIIGGDLLIHTHPLGTGYRIE